MLRLTHISDCHIGPLPKLKWHDLLNKRLFGYLNWQRHRKHVHKREVLDAICQDMVQQHPDHIVVTGDLVNLALPQEYDQAMAWLENLAEEQNISVVPGNHDSYIAHKTNLGFRNWQAYMTSQFDSSDLNIPRGNDFPFVRILKEKVALIGVSSSVATLPFMATGRLGIEQCQALKKILTELKSKQFFRIILIHHPPCANQAPKRRALEDAKTLENILMQNGAELVLHGHNHTSTHQFIKNHFDNTQTHIIGVPSASCSKKTKEPLARFHQFEIQQKNEGWECKMIARGFKTMNEPIVEIESKILMKV